MKRSEQVQRWRAARAARDAARAELVAAEVDSGARRRLSRPVRFGLVVVAVLAVVGAGLLVWRAAVAGPEFSDQQMVDAAGQRAELLLTADAGDPKRARQILAGATGEFHDSFAQSAESYTEFVAGRGSRGATTIDGAALASRDGDRAVVLVAASLRVESPSRPQGEAPVQVRLRVVVEPEDGVLKLSGVTFLP